MTVASAMEQGTAPSVKRTVFHTDRKKCPVLHQVNEILHTNKKWGVVNPSHSVKDR